MADSGAAQEVHGPERDVFASVSGEGEQGDVGGGQLEPAAAGAELPHPGAGERGPDMARDLGPSSKWIGPAALNGTGSHATARREASAVRTWTQPRVGSYSQTP